MGEGKAMLEVLSESNKPKKRQQRNERDLSVTESAGFVADERRIRKTNKQIKKGKEA